MINFEKFQLPNGLRVIIHEDHSTPMVAVNLLYNVGSKHEQPDKTGFAHLFEHLMFEGSVNIPNFDLPLQKAGGESNAFTSQDITNYWDILPANNLEVALWLESDRMLNINLSQHKLDTQKKVVIEEFKEHYINLPYGDVWHLLYDLSYRQSSYRWPVIGKELAHIEHATLDDTSQFFAQHYQPANAILCLAGGIKTEEAMRKVEKWFGPIPGRPTHALNYKAESKQSEARKMTVKADVPMTGIYKAYHFGSRLSDEFYAVDVLSRLLTEGDSSRMYKSLVKERKIFSEICVEDCATDQEGLLVIDGLVSPGIEPETAVRAIDEELDRLCQHPVPPKELEKAHNKKESNLAFEEVNIIDRAMKLCHFELIAQADLVNEEAERYRSVSPTDILDHAQRIFTIDNSSTLIYLAE